MRALHAKRDAIAQRGETLGFPGPNEWRDGAQTIERVAPGAWWMLALALDPVEGTQRKLDRGGKLVHRFCVIMPRS
jgi:hypothetical protein